MASNGTFSVRRMLSVLLSAALLCGVLAACGPGGAEATPPPTQTPAADTPTPAPTQVPATPAPTPEATPAPTDAPGPLPSPTEGGGENPTPAPTPETTPEPTPDTPRPSPTAGQATPRPSQSPRPTDQPTPAPTQEPELACNVPDATSLKAAGMTAGQKVFTNGVTAEQFLAKVNDTIARWELTFAETYGSNGPSDQFNWHTSLTGNLEGQTVLTQVKREVLSALGASNEKTWTDAYSNFDIQVYYSQLIDLLGQPLPWGSPDYTGPALTQVA